MRFKILLFLLIFSQLIILSSCRKDGPCINGDGDMVTENRDVSGFTFISFEGEGTVYVSQGSEYSLSISAEQNILNDMITEVIGDELRIFNDHCIHSHKSITVHITLPNPEGVSFSGSGDIVISSAIYTNNIELSLSGSGNISTMDSIVSDEVEVSISGSGNIDVIAYTHHLTTDIDGSGNCSLSGEADEHTIDINGSGDLHSFDLLTDTTTIDINGSGDAEVFVNDFLDVDISGSGNVYYKGYPVISIQVSGSGQLINRN